MENKDDASWTEIPTEALSGPCKNPECRSVTCLDPWCTEHQGKSGRVVIVSYKRPDGNGGNETVFRINGAEIIVIPGDALATDPALHAQIVQAVGGVHGRDGIFMLAKHLMSKDQRGESGEPVELV